MFFCAILSHAVGRLASPRRQPLGWVRAIGPRLSADDGGIAVRRVIDRQAEDALEGYTPPVATVEAEGIFLQVSIQVLDAEAMECAHAPSLHQREDPVDPEQDEVGGHLANDALVENVAPVLRAFVEAEVRAVAVGQQRRAWRDVLPHEGVDQFLRLVGDDGQADTAGTRIPVGPIEVCFRRLAGVAVDDLHSANDDGPAFGGACAVVRTERNFGLVDLDEAVERLPFAVGHRRPELVQQQPGGILLDANLVRQLKGRDAVRMSGDQMCRPEPDGERQLGPVQDGPGGHRCLPSAAQALEGIGPRLQPGGTTTATRGTDEADRPPMADEKFGAGRLVGEFGLELGQGSGATHVTSISPQVQARKSTYSRSTCLPGTPGEALVVDVDMVDSFFFRLVSPVILELTKAGGPRAK